MTTSVDATIALVTLAEAKEYLKVTTSNEDAIISHLINAISAWVQGYLKRDLVSKTYTEYYSGDGERELQLKNYPVISVTSVCIDALRAFAASDNVDVSANLIIKRDAGILRTFNLLYGFTAGDANIKVVYVAGYTAASDGTQGGVTAPQIVMPYDIRMAVKRILDQHWRLGYTQRKLDHQSESIAGMNITFRTDAIPKDVISMLDGWKKSIPAPQYEYAD